ncbi:MAG: PEP-CTERM sorting domain-containing protein [Pyrinomonadaceae bacterium]
MKLKQLMLAAFALATLLLLPAATQADPLVFDNSPPVIVTGQGSTVMFSITIRNDGPGTLTITGAEFGGFTRIIGGMGDAGIEPDILPFFENFVLFDPEFETGESRSGVALSVTIGPDVAFGIYRGLFTIFYDGAPPGGQIVAQDFTVNVVPEPATMVLLGTGLAGVVGARLRRRRRGGDQNT